MRLYANEWKKKPATTKKNHMHDDLFTKLIIHMPISSFKFACIFYGKEYERLDIHVVHLQLYNIFECFVVHMWLGCAFSQLQPHAYIVFDIIITSHNIQCKVKS